MTACLRVIVLFVFLQLLPAFTVADPLPRPPGIQPAVDFWVRIYSEVSTQQGLLHDRDNLAVVYEPLQFTENLWHPSRERLIKRRRAHYAAILNSLASGKRTGLTDDEARVLALWPEGVSNARLARAADNIRFQLGQRDRFLRGLERSGAWEPHMREIMAEMGLPPQLAALPHVESSFNPDAYSRVGAAGIWQFTRLTGRRFMRVDHVVDERMDPFTATRAAGRLLKLNHSVTGDWALAITGYNHGLAGIRRAARTVGSNDIGDIIARYDGRRWGFASRNFYPSFLAAVEVDENAPRYFGKINYAAPFVTQKIELTYYVPIDAVLAAFKVDRVLLRELNRGLLEPVWTGKKYVPKGYALRLPVTEALNGPDALAQALDRIPAADRFAAQVPDRFHQVARGESLSTIASRYGVSMKELLVMNALRSPHHIRAGSTLRLPVHGPVTSEREVWRVARGDSLSSIAEAVDMKVADLAAANGLTVDHTLQVGDVLRVDGEPSVLALAEVEQPGQVSETVSEPVYDIPPVLDAATEPTAPVAAPDVLAMARELQESIVVNVGRLAPAAPADAGLAPEEQYLAQETEAALAADPSDYSVAADNSIEIQAIETLGHYAEWLDIRASDLRRINNMRYGMPLVIGKRLTLAFDEVPAEQFEQRRRAFHSQVQSAFFENHQIRGSEDYRVKRGDSLWTLTAPRTEIPVWLMRQYNPDVDFSRLQPGDTLQRPVIETAFVPTAE